MKFSRERLISRRASRGEEVVAFDDGRRPEMTMAELADHFDQIQRLAEARADATLKAIRERVDEAVAEDPRQCFRRRRPPGGHGSCGMRLR